MSLVAGTPQMLRYANQNLMSEFPLPALRCAAGSTASAAIQVTAPVIMQRLRPIPAWLHEWREADGRVSLQLALSHVPPASPRHVSYVLRTLGLCDFLIDPVGGVIGIEQVPGVDAHTLEHLLIDQVLPRLLASQGALVVHACCIRIGGRGALFLGQSGWGKSTLAGLLQQRGHEPMSDDCAVLDLGIDAIRATPTYPSLRLYDDSIQHAFDEVPGISSVAGYTKKRRVHIDTAPQGEATSIDAIYLLNDPMQSVAQPAIEPLQPTQACMALIEHSFRLDLTARDQSARQFGQAATVARTIPAFGLHYPRDYSQANAVLDKILAHFGNTLEAHPTSD